MHRAPKTSRRTSETLCYNYSRYNEYCQGRGVRGSLARWLVGSLARCSATGAEPRARYPASSRSNEPTHNLPIQRGDSRSGFRQLAQLDVSYRRAPGSCHPRRIATNRRQKQNTAPAMANGIEGR